MSERRSPGELVSLETTYARNARTVRAAQTMVVARLANAALLDHPPSRLLLEDAAAGNYSLSWVPSAQAEWLWLSWLPGPVATAWASTVTVTVTVRDDAGHSWTASSGSGIAGETFICPTLRMADRFADTGRQVAWLRVSDLRAAGLTGTSWSIDVTVGGSGFVLALEAWELPRGWVDENVAAAGIPPGAFVTDAPIAQGDTDGLHRLLDTIAAARLTQAHYLSLAWPQVLDNTKCPATSVFGTAAFTLLREGPGNDPVPMTVRVRRVLAASALGEPIRWRVNYYRVGGAVAQVYLATGTSWGLASTGALAVVGAWTWSPWAVGYLKSNGTGELDTITLTGDLSAGGSTLYMAGIDVRGACT